MTRITVLQTVRLFFLIAVLVPLLGWLEGEEPDVSAIAAHGDAWWQYPLLVVVCAVVAWAGVRSRVPGGLILGALVGSAVLHGVDVVTVGVPPFIATPGLVAIGALIGSRLQREDRGALPQLLPASVGAFGAVGRISPDYLCMDGTIPRAKLPLVLRRIRELSEHYGLRVANVFHAGDGNLHPLILYDANKPGELEKTEAFGGEILKLCVEVGGVLTGEHGVGVEKRDLMPAMFSEEDLNQQQRLKCAFDAQGLLNPGKVFPKLHRCAELGHLHVHAGKLPFPDIPRF
mgnify:CR=1 FL=1